MHASRLTALLVYCQTQNTQTLLFAMAYKLDLRKSVANFFGELSTNEILKVFKDKPISRSTIFNVIKDCREGKLPENKKKSGRPPKLSARATKSLLSSAKNQAQAINSDIYIIDRSSFEQALAARPSLSFLKQAY